MKKVVISIALCSSLMAWVSEYNVVLKRNENSRCFVTHTNENLRSNCTGRLEVYKKCVMFQYDHFPEIGFLCVNQSKSEFESQLRHIFRIL